MLLHPAAPGRLYQQNHVGTYVSDDRGDSWKKIHKGLPGNFGFGMAVDPNDAEACYVVPLQPEQYAFRATPGRFAVYRGGASGWRALGRGLPEKDAYLSVLREGLANDALKPAGVYVGTGTGQLFGSPDAGRTWNPMAMFLPPILSVSAAVV